MSPNFAQSFFTSFIKRRLALLVDDIIDKPRAILISPAQDITHQTVNELITLASGLLFVALSPERTSMLALEAMSRTQNSLVRIPDHISQLAMCTSVEAREGVSTGISAADRAVTIGVLGEPIPERSKLVKPGHIFPIKVREGGVLVHHALAEGALDIVRISGFTDAAAYAEILNSNGALPSIAEINQVADKNSLPVITLTELTRHRLQSEKLVYRVAEAKLPTDLAGQVRSFIYKSSVHEGEHLAIVKGEIVPDRPTLVRVQLESTISDVFGGDRFPTRKSLHLSMQAIGNAGSGVVLYLKSPFSGQLRHQVKTWNEESEIRFPSMIREYGLGSQILKDLGVGKIELLTNTSRDFSGVKAFGIEIVSQRSNFIENI